MVFIVCFFLVFGVEIQKPKNIALFEALFVLEHCQKQKHTRAFFEYLMFVLPLQTFAFRNFMNAPSTLYSAPNPEIAFASVCKREGIQDSRFKIHDLRFKTQDSTFKILEFWILNLQS